jgi:hypothetical protein
MGWAAAHFSTGTGLMSLKPRTLGAQSTAPSQCLGAITSRLEACMARKLAALFVASGGALRLCWTTERQAHVALGRRR